jgi:hypothetical protein
VKAMTLGRPGVIVYRPERAKADSVGIPHFKTQRICPRCHNLAVQPEKKREWFELFCVPVVPYSCECIVLWADPPYEWWRRADVRRPNMQLTTSGTATYAIGKYRVMEDGSLCVQM